MAMQIIEITEIHPQDAYYSYVGTDIDRVGTIHAIDSTKVKSAEGDYKQMITEQLGVDIPDNPSRFDCFYAVKYKVLFGVR